ncbi:MAG: hypothetical protein Kow001_07290 [Acidobacteriota bacterium]
MIVEPLILIRYFASRGMFTLPVALEHGNSPAEPAAEVLAAPFDVLALDARRRTVHFAKVLSRTDLTQFPSDLPAELPEWIGSQQEWLRAGSSIAADWQPHVLFLVPGDTVRELQTRWADNGGPQPRLSVVPVEDLLFPDRWPALDSALEAATEPRPRSPEKPVVSADVAARQLREAWIERASRNSAEPHRSTSGEQEDSEILLERLRIKAEASSLAAERERALLDGRDSDTEIAPRLSPVFDRAKALPGCYLWMLHPTQAPAAAPEVFELLEHCYTNTAEALELALAVDLDPAIPEEARKRSLELLAEAQSALRSQAATLGTQDVREQLAVFLWLREVTQQRRIYVSRYMRQQDKADPNRWQDLQERIHELRLQMGASAELDRQRRRLWGKIRHKVSLLQDAGATESDLGILMDTITELLETGIAPSDPTLRDLLLPHLDAFPERAQCPAGLQRVLQEMDRFLADQAQLEERRRTGPPSPPESASVQRVADILRGQSVLLIGGCCRPQSKEALERAFGLGELIWLETSEHGSVTAFEPYVSRPDVALVLLAIRWSSHSFGEVSRYCERYRKPLVRLPSGYNPNQVAEQILRQQGDRLGIPADRSGGESSPPTPAG